MTGPLAGVRVVDVTQSAAGPYCTMILGDLGADVVKVEKPHGGDDARGWAPPYWGTEGCTFLALNRNKRSLPVDLACDAGKSVFTALVRGADVLVQNLRAGALDRLGFGYAAVTDQNPRLVYCSITAYGGMGPKGDRPGYDPLMQAYGGLMSLTGEAAPLGGPARPPVRVGTSINDMGTGLWAVVAILTALMERERTGRGQLVETSLLETAVSWIPYQIMAYLGSATVPRPQGSGTAMNAPYEAFPTADGHLMVAAGNDALWEKLCTAIGAVDLLADPRFRGNPARVRHRQELAALLARTFRTQRTAHWERVLDDAGVPSSPIRTVDQVVHDEQVEELELVRPVDHPRIDGYREVALPVRWNGVRTATRRVPPALGADTREVLTSLGRTSAEIDALIAAGVVAAEEGRTGCCQPRTTRS